MRKTVQASVAAGRSVDLVTVRAERLLRKPGVAELEAVVLGMIMLALGALACVLTGRVGGLARDVV